MRRQQNSPDGVKVMERHDDAAPRDAGGRDCSGGAQCGAAARPAPPISSAPGDFAQLADYLSDAVVRYDRQKRRIYCNSAHRRYAELAGERLEGRSVRQASIFSPEDTAAYDQGLDRVLATGEPLQFDFRLPRVFDADGQAIQLSINIHAEFDDSGAVCGILTTGRDVTALKRSTANAETKAREFQTLVELTPDFVIRYDLDLQRTYCNPAAQVLPKQSTNLGRRTDQESCLPDPSAYIQSLKRCMDEKRMQECETRWINNRGELRDGHILMTPEFDKAGAVCGALAIGRDVTELVRSREAAKFLARHDPLTGLINHAQLAHELEQAIASNKATGEEFSLLYLDLDDFKRVNDNFGHGCGDELLRQVARRLREGVGERAIVARPSGDEFAIVLIGLGSLAAVRNVATAIFDQFTMPFDLLGREATITVSLGAARYPIDCAGAAELIKCADAAMYAAKKSGKNKIEFYSSEITARAVERTRMESALRGAVERDEFELHYQPKYDMSDNRLVGAEALVRWNSREFGLTSPIKFIPVAEDTGQIIEIGEWIICEAVRTSAAWNQGRANPIPVAINLSGRQFEGARLYEQIARALSLYACEPGWIEVEITESLLVDAFPNVRETLDKLHSGGVRIAIDDFGTGYSALSYLSRLPIDILKIDRSFVLDLLTDQRNCELVKAIISVAKALDLDIIAEGVELDEHERILMKMGCRVAQGFLYSKPLTRKDFESLALAPPRQSAVA
jgi:diguanylate cyclase (GGDEF)-like protein/PAS domain S-box-containing protein